MDTRRQKGSDYGLLIQRMKLKISKLRLLSFVKKMLVYWNVELRTDQQSKVYKETMRSS